MLFTLLMLLSLLFEIIPAQFQANFQSWSSKYECFLAPKVSPALSNFALSVTFARLDLKHRALGNRSPLTSYHLHRRECIILALQFCCKEVIRQQLLGQDRSAKNSCQYHKVGVRLSLTELHGLIAQPKKMSCAMKYHGNTPQGETQGRSLKESVYPKRLTQKQPYHSNFEAFSPQHYQEVKMSTSVTPSNTSLITSSTEIGTTSFKGLKSTQSPTADKFTRRSARASASGSRTRPTSPSNSNIQNWRMYLSSLGLRPPASKPHFQRLHKRQTLRSHPYRRGTGTSRPSLDTKYTVNGIARLDIKRKIEMERRTFSFFNAPFAGIMQSLLLALTAQGFGSRVDVSVVGSEDVLRKELGIRDEFGALCGMAIRYEDKGESVKGLRGDHGRVSRREFDFTVSSSCTKQLKRVWSRLKYVPFNDLISASSDGMGREP
ncbi:uncharacterized protein BDR25DRAFT_359395 [Lindgomyces ingoldianus]|uniref:Uncharacterized protein n=1 Tax=Lindgomyces ingoldianus TaxID=673940 RepID=A0ACB6QK42_9PLEO|nr:uncharacterized protein BDR25DRAFT_359395 [Lindgomyces ingoldianus]KAF2466505.1 hypothetical protein BDR25DRAFT_359395 [Lindgomyces ingoldianus]